MHTRRDPTDVYCDRGAARVDDVFNQAYYLAHTELRARGIIDHRLLDIVIDMQLLTLKNYYDNKPHFSEEDCQHIAAQTFTLMRAAFSRDFNKEHINQFKSAIEPYYSCSKLARVATLLIGVLLGCVVGTGLGAAVVGTATGMAGLGLFGAYAGYLSARQCTVWHNRTFVNTAEELVEQSNRLLC